MSFRRRGVGVAVDVVPGRIADVMEFVPHVHRDHRGFFTRTFDAAVARAAGLDPDAFVQDSQSRSSLGGIRGLHVRRSPGEAKLVRCAHGAVFDVVVDLRPTSPTYLQWETFRLDDVDHHVLHVPRGCAHGWQALTATADVCYRIDAEHEPGSGLTAAYDDPALGIPWPLPPGEMSRADREAPPLAEVLAVLNG